jgi:hypothetical protein
MFCGESAVTLTLLGPVFRLLLSMCLVALYYDLSIGVITSIRIIYAAHVARMGDIRNTYILVRKPERRR